MWSKIALVAAIATPILHCIVLVLSNQNAISDPISELSRSTSGGLQTLGLILFGIAHVAVAIELGGRDRGRLWPIGRGLIFASSALLFYVAFYFVSADAETLRGPAGNDLLWIVATLIGLSMGALQPGLSRLSRGLGLFSAVCLGLWLWLALLALFVDSSWLGLYERMVGIVYVTWIAGVAAGLLKPGGRAGSVV